MSTLDILDPMTEYEGILDRPTDPDSARSDTTERELTQFEPHLLHPLARSRRHRAAHGPSPANDRTGLSARYGHQSDTRMQATLASLPMPLVELVERALAAVSAALVEPPLDEELWGPTTDEADAIRGAITAAVADWQAAERLRQTSLTPDDVADRLDVPLSTLARLAARREVVAYDHAGTQWFPAWQFESGLPGSAVRRAWQRFPGDAIWLSEWVHEPQPALGGRTPLDRLREDDVDSVLLAVEALTT